MSTERLKAREAFHEKCRRMGWPTECGVCGNGLEDPENDIFDAFCDFCCTYETYEPDTQARHDAWIEEHRIR